MRGQTQAKDKQLPMRVGEQGFTLIELIVVIVIIGILGAAGSVGIGRTRAQAYLAVMKADLRSISIAQEAYFQVQSADGKVDSYADAIGDLDVVTSDGVTVELTGDVDGWAARTMHPGAPGRRCSLFRGSATPYAPATSEGLLTCD
jgi:prepilin-type N-terminal cleavage/methylation domain-containing protein